MLDSKPLLGIFKLNKSAWPVNHHDWFNLDFKIYQEILHKNPIIKGTREQPRWNIAAGIFYDRTIWNLWLVERPLQDRLKFMFGSYNAGKGSILKAQKIDRHKFYFCYYTDVKCPDRGGFNHRGTVKNRDTQTGIFFKNR
jgi:hypothetical protein